MVTGWLMFTLYAHKQLTVTVDSSMDGVPGAATTHSLTHSVPLLVPDVASESL